MSTVAPVRFPFWVLMPNESTAAAPERGTFPLAFSETAAISDYMSPRKTRDGKMRLVNHQTLLLFVADLHRFGLAGIRLDPQSDGSGGTEVPISELMKLT
jgi:hypothetical protein